MRRILVVVVVLMALVLPAALAAQKKGESIQWRITKVMPVHESETLTDSSRFLVNFQWGDEKIGIRREAELFTYADLRVAAKLFNVAKPQDLVGKTIEDPYEISMGPDFALQRKIFFARNPDYKRPFDEKFYDIVISDLARGSCPDFSEHDPWEVQQLFVQFYRMNFPAGQIVGKFVREAEQISGGKVVGTVFKLPAPHSSGVHSFGDVIEFGVQQGEEKRIRLHLDPFPDGRSLVCFEEEYDRVLQGWTIKSVSQ